MTACVTFVVSGLTAICTCVFGAAPDQVQGQAGNGIRDRVRRAADGNAVHGERSIRACRAFGKSQATVHVVDGQIAGCAGIVAYDRQTGAVGRIDNTCGDTNVRVGDGCRQSVQCVVSAVDRDCRCGWLPT